ncbi:MAG: hypothetical protein FWC86_05275, partial [Coriobacteriia bacterium]|nr:hypothetical protein [Coriobacteriia bacterium]
MSDFLSYGLDQHERLLTALGQHVVLTLVALLLSILFAALITAVLHKIPKVGEYVQGSLSALYSV